MTKIGVFTITIINLFWHMFQSHVSSVSDCPRSSPVSYNSTYTYLLCWIDQVSIGYRGGGVDYGNLCDMLVQGVCFAISKLWKAWAWRGVMSYAGR